jgi:multidrug efflux pump subunit AcrA (membrane-fusion protein)
MSHPTCIQRRATWRIHGILACLLLGAALIATRAAGDDHERLKNLVILDPIGIQNLKLETITADDQIFQHVIFAGGRVEAVPSASAVVASRTAGRVLEVKVAPGDIVSAGMEVLRVEGSAASGDPAGVALTAPIDGMVTALHVRQGETFRRIKTLVEITNLREVDIIARLPEHEAALLGKGTSARILVPAACDKLLKGEVMRFGTEGDRKHGTVEAYFRLPNRDLLMRPGMRAEFRIVAAERKVSALPRDAVQGNAADRFVFVKDYEIPNAFMKVPVVTGLRNDRFVEIVQGLAPGDEVVTTGAYALTSPGRGSVDLKAALDAAHGHLHHEDGTPMDAEHEGHDDHEHGATVSGAPPRITPLTLFFASLSILLFGLLFLSRRHRPQTAA